MGTEHYGSGPRMYLGVHGWAGNRRTFRRFAAHVPEDSSFYTPDLPGYGGTAPPARWEASEVVAALQRTMAEHRMRDVTVVGHCGGALFACALAQHAGSPVSRLVLIDPFAYLPWYFAVFLKGDFGRYAYLSTFANPLGRWITNLSLAGKRKKDTNLTEAFADVDHRVAHHYLVMMASYGSAAHFAGIPCAVDIAYGQRTFKAIREGIAQWRVVLPQARVFELAGAGHEPLREAVEPLASIFFAPESASGREVSAAVG